MDIDDQDRDDLSVETVGCEAMQNPPDHCEPIQLIAIAYRLKVERGTRIRPIEQNHRNPGLGAVHHFRDRKIALAPSPGFCVQMLNLQDVFHVVDLLEMKLPAWPA